MNRLIWFLLITAGVVAIPVVECGWWLLSPLFIDQSYDLGSALGWGASLWIHMVGCRVAHIVPHTGRDSAELERGCCRRNLSFPGWTPDVWRGSGGDAPRDGGRPKPLVDYPTTGRHGTGGPKATAGAYSRSCPVDSGGSDGPDALHASRLRRFEHRPSAFGILTGDNTEGANHASNLPWRAVGNEKSC